ncbi:MAG: 2-oxoacid:acceptor oxidoreductase family protein [Planctomycetes bacterium]|nr:2-oxoacid:acceptor oxidoreductase family protein [Planctomycetota bacterium]
MGDQNRIEIRIAGIGGQGVIYAANLLGRAASLKYNHVAVSASYGPESRGSAAKSEIVISDEPIDYPHAISPNILLVMHQQAYDEYADQVAKDGLIVLDSFLVVPTAVSRTVHSIDATRIARDQLKVIMLANLILIGFFARVSKIVSSTELIRGFEDMVPVKSFALPDSIGDQGKKALELGLKY